MRLSVNHRTVYRFSDPARRVVQLARVVPGNFIGQTVVHWNVDVDCDARVRRGRDGYGNETRMIYVDGPVEGLAIAVTGEVVTEDRAGVVIGANETLPPMLFLRSTALTGPSDAIADFARDVHDRAHGSLDRMHLLKSGIHERMRFDTAETDVGRTAEEAWTLGHGVCQDFAHIFVAAARAMGVPARYVSGHLFRRDGAGSQPAAHAWAEACIEDLGWVGFDPANAICPDDAYVRVAVGLDYREAAPLVGARTGGGIEQLDVDVSVQEAQGRHQAQS